MADKILGNNQVNIYGEVVSEFAFSPCIWYNPDKTERMCPYQILKGVCDKWDYF